MNSREDGGGERREAQCRVGRGTDGHYAHYVDVNTGESLDYI